jgi:hypothetical protein
MVGKVLLEVVVLVEMMVVVVVEAGIYQREAVTVFVCQLTQWQPDLVNSCSAYRRKEQRQWRAL